LPDGLICLHTSITVADKDDVTEDGEVGIMGAASPRPEAAEVIEGGEYPGLGTYALLLKWLCCVIVVAEEFFPALLFEVTIRARLGDEDTEGDGLDTLRLF
jgi:hypothetical protein